MLEGREGPAIARAMDLLVRYGEALGAERLVDTNNVCGTVGATTPLLRDELQKLFEAQRNLGNPHASAELHAAVDELF